MPVTPTHHAAPTHQRAPAPPLNTPAPPGDLWSGHLPHIDGLRGGAVILVVLFHAFPETWPGGFIGVDVFFVISGYVITRLLLREHEAGRADYRRFLVRRVRRLGPTFLLVSAATLALGWLIVVDPADYVALAHAVSAGLALSANWFFFATTDYFNPDQASNLFLHAWSLSVEEQFYLIFPLIVFWAAPSTRRLWTVLGALAAVSLAWALWSAAYGGAQGAFFATHLRVWELLAGALVHLGERAWTHRRPQWVQHSPWAVRLGSGAAILAVLVILVAALALTQSGRYPGPATLIPVLATAACLTLARPERALAGRLLRWGPLRYVGRISYALYLWHWPILAALGAMAYAPGPGVMALGVAVSAGLAAVTYHTLEHPVRTGVRLRSDGALAGAILAGVAAVGLFSAAIMAGAGAPHRLSPEAQAAFIAPRSVAAPEAIRCAALNEIAARHAPSAEPVASAEPAPTPDLEAPPGGRACWLGDVTGTDLDVVVWGDSHGAAMEGAIAETLFTQGRTGVLVTRGACPPLLGVSWDKSPPADARACVAHNAAVAAFIAAVQPDRVVLIGHWDIYAPAPRPFGGVRPARLRAATTGASQDVSSTGGASTGGASTRTTPQPQGEPFAAAIHETLAALDDETQVWVLLDAPTHPIPVLEALAYARQWPWAPDPAWLTRTGHERARALYAPDLFALAEDGRLGLVDPLLSLCPQEVCLSEIDGAPAYFDANHLSAAGAAYVLARHPELLTP